MRIMIKGGVWKNTEDEILKAAVMKYGKNQWARVASLLTRKSAKQCKARWYEWLEPSIKKVEWSREEEEKLLHLVKLMPSQWRTIAPLVGRTAAQCMEHYEYLLDSIAENKEGNNEENSKSNKNNLQLGEIDPIPETKPARPDPIDMDEDEKEMLSEARARLANTKGKKAKRKAREKQLQEAKKLTILQKKRELKAAGIYSGNSQQHLHNKKRKFIDYIKEIPFEKNVPIGLHDINHENMIDNTLSLRSAAKEAMKNEEKRRDAQEKKQRQIDTKRQKVLEKIALDEHIKRINQINDPHSHIKKQALKLSAPEMTNEEYEHAMKISKNNIDLLKQLKATGNDAQQATNSLLSEIQISETPYRSSETDSILLTQRRNKEQESERKFQYDIYNLAAARHAQTPLLGGSNVEIQGENLPYQKDIDSTETETKKDNASSRFATPLSNIWTASRINENVLESIQEEDEDDKKLRRRMKQLENEKKQKLLYGFKKLPEPMNEYKLVVPERKENLEDEYVSKIAIAEEDAEELANRVRETEKARMELDLKLISNSNRKALPIPKLKQLENLLQLDEKEVEHLRSMNKDIDVEREIRKEMAKLIKGDMNQKRDASLPKYHKDYTLSELQRARNMVEMEMIFHCNYQSPTVRDQLSENVVGMAETKKKCHILLKKLKKQQKENDKINKKLKLLMNGYEIYEGQNNLEIMQALEQLSQKRIEEDFYRKLAANEKDYIIKKRVVELSEELEKYKKMEKELQELYYATHA